MSNTEKPMEPETTEEEKAAALAVIERLRAMREEMLRECGGKLFPNSVDDLDGIRPHGATHG